MTMSRGDRYRRALQDVWNAVTSFALALVVWPTRLLWLGWVACGLGWAANAAVGFWDLWQQDQEEA